LIELLMVMAILALVLGAGLGSLSGLNPGQRAAVGLVQNVVRSAHNSAIARGAPARVRIDREQGTLVAEGMEVIGTWHFEDLDLEGAEDLSGIFLGMEPELSEEGWLGRSLEFDGVPRGAAVEIPIQDDPAFDLGQGFAIDVALRPTALEAAQLLEVTGAFVAELTAGGGLRARIHRRSVDELGSLRRGTGVTVTSATGVLVVDRWNQVRFLHDHRALRILVDGIEVASAPADFDVWRTEGPLLIGGGSQPIPGRLDELALAVVSGSEQSALPEGVSFTARTPAAIEFAAGGALDPTVHRSGLEIGLEFPDGGTRTVRVGLYGTVE